MIHSVNIFLTKEETKRSQILTQVANGPWPLVLIISGASIHMDQQSFIKLKNEILSLDRQYEERRTLPIKLWQHEDTGIITASTKLPSKQYYEISTIREDELPADLTDKDYSDWCSNSFIDGGVVKGPYIMGGINA